MPISEAYNMDCMDYMAQFPDNHFELAIIDPPYGIGESGATNKSRGLLARSRDYKPFAGHDIAAPCASYFIELRRVSRNQIIFGANHFISQLQAPNASCWIVWDKENGATDFADCELAWTSFATAVRRFRFRWQGMLQEHMRNKEHRIHPTQKPVALYKWLLTNYAKPGDKILDTHLGSGSSRIAAWDLGFDFYATELDADYFNAQEKRFADHIAQPNMFAETEQKAEQSTLNFASDG